MVCQFAPCPLGQVIVIGGSQQNNRFAIKLPVPGILVRHLNSAGVIFRCCLICAGAEYAQNYARQDKAKQSHKPYVHFSILNSWMDGLQSRNNQILKQKAETINER
jgi:hypothetical protein